MASMGFLGAVKGGADGFGKFLSEDMKMKRETRMEEIRTGNRRETNRIDAETRNELSLGRLAEQAKSYTELESLRQEGRIELEEFRADNPSSESTALQTNLQFLTQPVEEGGFGLGREEAMSMVAPRGSSTPTRQEFIADLVKRSSGPDSIFEPDEIMQRANRFADELYPQEQGPGGARSQPAQSGSPPGGGPLMRANSLDEARAMLKNAAPSATDEQIRAKLQAERPDLFDQAPPQAAAPAPRQTDAPAPSPAPAVAAAPSSRVPTLSNMAQAMQGVYGGQGNPAQRIADGTSRAVRSAVDGMQGATDRSGLIMQYLNFKRAGVPYDEMPVPVLEAYIAELEPDHPEFDKIAQAIQSQSDAVAAR